MSIQFTGKDRKPGPLYEGNKSRILEATDWVKQNEIDEALEKTHARACFRACRTCGSCANSRRDATWTKSYDANAGKNIDCRKCEPHRYHDCHNGYFRNTRQEAEPFTQAQIDLIASAENGKPLI